MNPDRSTEVIVEAWLADGFTAQPDGEQMLSNVRAAVADTPQRRHRWWPFPVLGRRARTPTASDVTEHQPTHISSTNGHAPTVIRRTQTMFSPVKAITAGALVFAVGGAFLIAQPFDQQGGVPGAEQGASPAAPVEVNATLRNKRCEDIDSSEVDGRVVRVYGYTCTVENEWSDPRLQGTETFVDNYVDHVDGGLTIGHYVHNIVTDDGAWRMRPQFRFESIGPQDFSGTWVLDGEGAYEGLSVILAKEGNDLAGFIVESDLVPPPPEEGSTK